MTRTVSTQRAIKVVGSSGEFETVDDADLPQITPDEVLVRVFSVATNPADAKSCQFSPTVGGTVGSDFAGEVIVVGAAVRKQFAAGDRVCGLAFGNNPLRPDNGAFAEYVATPGDLLLKIPEGMGFDQASTLPCGLATAGLVLYYEQYLGLPLPSSSQSVVSNGHGIQKARHILIHGGGTATGTLLVQLAARSGLLPVTTSSPGRFEYLKSLGAVATFDYRSPSAGSDIRTYTHDQLAMAVDCIGITESMALCYEALGRNGGKYVALGPFPVRSHTRRSVRPSWVLALTVFGTPVMWNRPFHAEAKPKDRAFAEKFFAVAQQILDKGEIKTHEYEVRPGGLKGLVGGIDDVLAGRVTGRKLVYRVRE